MFVLKKLTNFCIKIYLIIYEYIQTFQFVYLDQLLQFISRAKWWSVDGIYPTVTKAILNKDELLTMKLKLKTWNLSSWFLKSTINSTLTPMATLWIWLYRITNHISELQCKMGLSSYGGSSHQKSTWWWSC